MSSAMMKEPLLLQACSRAEDPCDQGKRRELHCSNQAGG